MKIAQGIAAGIVALIVLSVPFIYLFEYKETTEINQSYDCRGAEEKLVAAVLKCHENHNIINCDQSVKYNLCPSKATVTRFRGATLVWNEFCDDTIVPDARKYCDSKGFLLDKPD